MILTVEMIIKQLQLVNRNHYTLFHGLLNFLRGITKYLIIYFFPLAKKDFTFAFAYYFEIRCQMNNKQTE